MALYINKDCIGCGPCEEACPRQAISKSDSFLGVFLVDPFLCNDCSDQPGGPLCVNVCPVDALQPEPAFPVCHGRGCPLTSSRLGGYDCSEGNQRCSCGNMLWRSEEDDAWRCSRCDMGMKVGCPKPASQAKLLGPTVLETNTSASPFGFDGVLTKEKT